MTSSRRDFLKGAASGVAGLAAAAGGSVQARTRQTMIDHVAPVLETVRFGLIGVGNRGMNHLEQLLIIDGAEVRAIADPDPVSIANARKAVGADGAKGIIWLGSGDHAWRAMLERDDIDAVIISTPWKWHAPMSIEAMKSGKHAFVEVPMATTIDEMWEMVEVSEATRMNCMMMENVNYGRSEMMVFNMVRHGLFGDLTHGEGAYIHDLRWQMKELERSTGSWRTYWHTKVNGNIYPTHGLGPIAQCMDINRGDRFDYMTSISSPVKGRAAYAHREFPVGHERNQLNYIKGDMNTSVIKTTLGRSIMVQYDTTTARPYSRLNLIQGTNGTFAGFPDRIALEIVPEDIRADYEADFKKRVAEWEASGSQGRKPRMQDFHSWDMGMEKWQKYFDHPFWRQMHRIATEAGGHGGMDYMMLWRMVYCLRNGVPLDQNVYDGAAWSAVMPLSHASVTGRGKSVDFPDFTRGAWKSAAKLEIDFADGDMV